MVALDVIPEKVEIIINRISPIQYNYFECYLVEHELDDFKYKCNVIIANANRLDEEIMDEKVKAYTRDIDREK